MFWYDYWPLVNFVILIGVIISLFKLHSIARKAVDKVDVIDVKINKVQQEALDKLLKYLTQPSNLVE